MSDAESSNDETCSNASNISNISNDNDDNDDNENDDDIEEIDNDDIIEYEKQEIDTHVIVNKNNRKTSFYLQQPELAKVIAIRAEQISNNGIFYTTINKKFDSAIKISIKEIYDKRCPLKIKRHVGKNKYEEFSVNEMIIDSKLISNYTECFS
jgi:hypothetical protein